MGIFDNFHVEMSSIYARQKTKRPDHFWLGRSTLSCWLNGQISQSQLIPSITPKVLGRMGPKKCDGIMPPLAL